MVPLSLERLANMPTGTSRGRHVLSIDKIGFTDVGGATFRAATQSTPQRDEHNRRPSSLRVSGSAIADEDMVRIRGAAALIMGEETVHGR